MTVRWPCFSLAVCAHAAVGTHEAMGQVALHVRLDGLDEGGGKGTELAGECGHIATVGLD